MANSLITSASGLRVFVRQLDVVGNNLANAGTTGFKGQRVLFADALYRTLQPGTGPSTTVGGSNPIQVGTGVQVAAFDSNLAQGPINPGANPFDLAIQGDGFFVLSDGTQVLYTRAGAFTVAANGLLVDSVTGLAVQRFGTVGEGTATSPAFQAAGNTNILIPPAASAPGQPTANVTLRGNLNASVPVGGTFPTTVQVFDAQGAAHTLTLVFTKTAANTWDLTGSLPAAEGVVAPDTIAGLTFGGDGALLGPATGTMTFTITAPNPLPPRTVTFRLGTVNGFDGLTQFGGDTTAQAASQDGFGPGSLNGISVEANGTLVGNFSNSATLPIAQLALATFPNPAGLNREGDSAFSLSAASGNPELAAPQTGRRGSVLQQSLEGSNVDVTTELTQLILTQQNFNANANGFRVSNEILQELGRLFL